MSADSTAEKKIKVLVADDSAFMRKLITDILTADPNIEVLDRARDGVEAVAKTLALRPDVVTLDVEMPKKNGLDALKEIMEACPTPVVMVSNLTREGADITMRCLAAGAVDFVTKPSGSLSLDIRLIGDELRQKVAVASKVAVRSIRMPKTLMGQSIPAKGSESRDPATKGPIKKPDKRIELVVIASSTGGPRALQEVIPTLPENFPVPILIVQHMPEGFTTSFASRLHEISKIQVIEGFDGLKPKKGMAVIAPGGLHMVVTRSGQELICSLEDTPPVRSVKPAADVLFASVAEVFDGGVLVIVMTGMGKDGMDGARLLKAKGAFVIAEAQETCVVYGMPRAVVEAKLADEVIPLNNISQEIVRLVTP